ncbi:sigma-54-dependent transcriptional regulator [Rhodobium gokarnense]|uniref:DNA-binding transcriptional regulator NtrC n=1 Tax=Rhodobium gokarnense TaxID=364296 RepID=A0ABT3H6W1_9HYPH|nr:sigma-54 dependent transcriptional regulator [Rhodobium gokarnense]MCW2306125.1 DNA-binding NtrC family response regulator [Rhodobium gokarnense]
MTKRILIVDDDPVQRRLLEEAVKRFGFGAVVAEGGEQALSILNGPEAADIGVVVLDIVMPDLDGMGVLTRMREAGITIPVIVQTGQGGIDTVVGSMRAGAYDFVVKPVSPERLEVSIRNALKVTALEGEVSRIKRFRSGTLTFSDIVTSSPPMERVIRLGERAATSNIPILIEGESGVGKEMVARAIQGSSERAARPFVTVNCGAIPDNLVESILFGHEKGAFTGAVDKHVGKFQEANGGTLFLDEVGELPAEVQVKLLRALQEGEVDPIGARRPVAVDFRLISATNRRLLDLVKEGRFREDLYYRLNVFPIWIPPLRDRREDIPKLVQHFIARFAAEEGKRYVNSVAPAAMQMLMAYDWPGNIRQLENAVFRAVVLCDGECLTEDEFPQIAYQTQGSTQPTGAPSLDPAAAAAGPSEPSRPAAPSASAPVPPQPAPAAPAPSDASRQTPFGFLRALDDTGHVRPVDEVEADIIRIALDHYRGRMAEVARRLKIGRSTLYRKVRDYGLDAPADDEAAE